MPKKIRIDCIKKNTFLDEIPQSTWPENMVKGKYNHLKYMMIAQNIPSSFCERFKLANSIPDTAAQEVLRMWDNNKFLEQILKEKLVGANLLLQTDCPDHLQRYVFLKEPHETVVHFDISDRRENKFTFNRGKPQHTCYNKHIHENQIKLRRLQEPIINKKKNTNI